MRVQEISGKDVHNMKARSLIKQHLRGGTASKGCLGGVQTFCKNGEKHEKSPGCLGASRGFQGGSRGFQRFWAEKRLKTRKNQKNAPELYG